MIDSIIRNSNVPVLSIFLVLVIASSMYIFDASAPWNEMIASMAIPAPETQPALNIEPIQQFFSSFDEESKRIYFYYEAVVDAFFYLSVTGFSLCLIGLGLKSNEWLRHRARWVIFLPLTLLCFELVESVSLLTIMSNVPARIDTLLWISDISTTLKILNYGVLILIDLAILVFLVVGLRKT